MTLHDKQAESDVALCASQADGNATIRAERAQSTQQQTALDVKWATWVNQLQADQTKKQKDVNDDFMHRIAELQQQRAQQDARYGELQQRLHVSESAAQSSILYQSHSSPLVTVCAPPPPLPSVSYRMPLVQVPSVQRPPVFVCVSQASQQKGAHGAQSPHPLIPSNALPQVQVVDFEQPRKIVQSLLAQKTSEVA